MHLCICAIECLCPDVLLSCKTNLPTYLLSVDYNHTGSQPSNHYPHTANTGCGYETIIHVTCVHSTPGSNPLLLQTNSQDPSVAGTDCEVLCEQHSIIHYTVNSKQEYRLDGMIADALVFYKLSSQSDRKYTVISHKLFTSTGCLIKQSDIGGSLFII